MGLLDRERSLTISSAVWIQYTNVTDGRSESGRQQRPCLRIASRGNEKLENGKARQDGEPPQTDRASAFVVDRVKISHTSNLIIVQNLSVISTCAYVGGPKYSGGTTGPRPLEGERG